MSLAAPIATGQVVRCSRKASCASSQCSRYAIRATSRLRGRPQRSCVAWQPRLAATLVSAARRALADSELAVVEEAPPPPPPPRSRPWSSGLQSSSTPASGGLRPATQRRGSAQACEYEFVTGALTTIGNRVWRPPNPAPCPDPPPKPRRTRGPGGREDLGEPARLEKVRGLFSREGARVPVPAPAPEEPPHLVGRASGDDLPGWWLLRYGASA